MKTLALTLSALIVAAPAFAQGGATPGGSLSSQARNVPEGSSEPGVDENGERRICRRIDDTSSRMASRRVCKTAREWREYERSF